MRFSAALALTALTTTSGAAFAQPFAEPTFYVWGNHFPSELDDGSYANLTNVVMVNAYGPGMVDLGTAGSQTPDPQAAALLAAKEILARIYTGSYQNPPGTTHTHTVADLSADKVCLTFFGLGRDLADCDGNQTSGPSRLLSNVRFFREEDRLPGMLDADNVNTPELDGFPSNPGSNGIGPSWNRSYRHPFLINAGDPGIGQPVASSPMRAWVLKFAEEYRWLQTHVYTGTNGTQRLPDPARVYLDTES